MIIPSNYTFKYIPNIEFDFRFVYIQGSAGSTNPVDLTNYTATWAVTSPSGTITYHLATSGQSGVFFGGDTSTPTNGIVDLVLIPGATNVLEMPVSYLLTLTPNSGNAIPLLFGSMINVNPGL